jgi:hypothetical protein
VIDRASGPWAFYNPILNSRESRHWVNCLLAKPCQQFEVFDVGEDPIVGDQRDLKPHRCRRHPAIRLMFFVAQAMSRPDAPGTERGVHIGEMGPRPDDLGPANLVLQPPGRSGPQSASLAPY